MNREDFLDTLRKQYAEEIDEAYLECEHESGKVDQEALKACLDKLMKSAKAEGLPPKEFFDLVQSTLPESCRGVLDEQKSKSAA